jgi:serine/threonine protein phosphatase PrpC
LTIGVRWGAATDAGRVRELNEDSLLAEPPLFAVADGVGGHAAGEVASGLAVAGLGRFVGSPAVEAASVLAAVHEANAEIRAHAADQPSTASESQRGMGSTVVGLALSWVDGAGAAGAGGGTDSVLVFNVGDSRAYRRSGGQLTQVSRDHSLVDELLRAGHITPEEAAVHPHRSVITRALGAAEEVDVDSWHLDALVGDRYLLCSDGLTNEVAVDALARVLASVSDPQEAAQQLVALALEHGGRDNVTAVVVDVAALEPWGAPAELPATKPLPQVRSDGRGPESGSDASI